LDCVYRVNLLLWDNNEILKSVTIYSYRVFISSHENYYLENQCHTLFSMSSSFKYVLTFRYLNYLLRCVKLFWSLFILEVKLGTFGRIFSSLLNVYALILLTFSIKTFCLCYTIFELNRTATLSYFVSKYFVFLLPNRRH
jgi:hypothetical protein